ncbi:MAG: aldo/keto reductase [Streptosporangiaceae bacterium]
MEGDGMAVPVVALNNGVAMPQVGLGLAKVLPEQAAETVLAAFEAGYRSLDTAADYGNEAGVGTAIAWSGLPRSEVFVTSKVRNTDHGRGGTLQAARESLERLGLERLDLYLIHWPVPGRDLYVETWHALEELYAAGLARSIGVCNFGIGHLTRLLAESSVVPAVNQFELHPRLQQHELRQFDAEHGIRTEAYSPFAKAQTLAEPELIALAERRGVTSAQLVLRWHVQLGHIVIPKSAHPSRMRENLAALDLDPLSDEELAVFASLDTHERIGFSPEEFV